MGAIVESGSSLLEDEDFGRDAIGRRFSSAAGAAPTAGAPPKVTVQRRRDDGRLVVDEYGLDGVASVFAALDYARPKSGRGHSDMTEPARQREEAFRHGRRRPVVPPSRRDTHALPRRSTFLSRRGRRCASVDTSSTDRQFLTRRPDRLTVGVRTAAGDAGGGEAVPGRAAAPTRFGTCSRCGSRRSASGATRPGWRARSSTSRTSRCWSWSTSAAGRWSSSTTWPRSAFRNSVELLASLHGCDAVLDVPAAHGAEDRQVAAAQAGAHRGARARVRGALPSGRGRRRGRSAGRPGAGVQPRRLLAPQRPRRRGSLRAHRLGPPEAGRPGARRRPLRGVVLAAGAPPARRSTTGRRWTASSPPTSPCAPARRCEERLDFHLAAALLRMVASRVELWREESYLIPRLMDEAMRRLR